jgi:hypothetical protein
VHGLGKMTLHEGEFRKGLSLMEASIQEFPLPLTYRNLASTLIFGATFMAVNGEPEESLIIDRDRCEANRVGDER